ncbi:unnamed protein product, partial [marine sediment metagenome]
APNFELSMNYLDYDSIWYTLNNSDPYIVNSLTGTIDQILWESLNNATIEIIFFMNDSLGNINIQSVEVYKNYKYPIIDIITPIPSYVCGTLAPNYIISIYSLGDINHIWYSLNEGPNFTVSSLMGILNQSLWADCGNGTVSLKFYANNSLGNIGSTEVIIQRDVYYPFIEIIKPLLNYEYGIKAPKYEVYISGNSTNLTWYTLNDGIKNFITEPFRVYKPNLLGYY